MKLSSSKIVSLLFAATALVAASSDAAAAATPTTTTTTTVATDYDVEQESSSAGSSLTFTALTKPLPLFPGEVTNTWHHLNIPDGPIAISEFFADIVEYDPTTGNIVEVPLSDAYLHHHVVYSEHKFYSNQKHWWSPMKPSRANRGVGFGAGTESRGTKQKFPFPYRFTTIQDENELLANVHVINTRTMSLSDAHHCLECPCTKEDRINLDTFGNEIIKEKEELEKKHHNGGGWFHWGHNNNKKDEEDAHKKCHHNSSLLEDVIERNHNWTRCNTELVEEHNTACSPDTYYGGLICCEHGEFCLDDYYMSQDAIDHSSDNSTQSVYYLRYTLTYTPVTPEIQPLSLAACCDASGNLTSSGNIEYDIPKCDDDDSVCVHELETIQELHGTSARAFGTHDSNAQEEDIYVDVVYMVGHLHRGGMSMKAYIESTGEVLCESLPTYGTGQSKEIGNEPNYINSMSSCTFNPPRRLKTTEKLRIVGKYNSTTAHTGVMSLFYIAIADVPGQEGGAATTSIVAASSESESEGGFWKTFQPIAIIVAAAIVIAATWHVVVTTKSHRTKSGYESLPGENQSLVV